MRRMSITWKYIKKDKHMLQLNPPRNATTVSH